MPIKESVESSIGRIRTVEFLGTLIPGLYLLTSVVVVESAVSATTWSGFKGKLLAGLGANVSWAAIAAFLVASYVAGSIVGAFPGRIVDHCVGGALKPLFKGSWLGAFNKPLRAKNIALYSSHFPYPAMLRGIRHELCQCGHLEALSDRSHCCDGTLPDDIEATSFEYWKTYVAARNPILGVLQDSAEARTRLFYGMFWSTFLGFGLSLLAALLAKSAFPLAWSGISFCCFFVFALRYRFVAGQEVRTIYICFLVQSCIERRKEQPNDGLGPACRDTSDNCFCVQSGRGACAHYQKAAIR